MRSFRILFYFAFALEEVYAERELCIQNDVSKSGNFDTPFDFLADVSERLYRSETRHWEIVRVAERAVVMAGKVDLGDALGSLTLWAGAERK